MKYTDEQLSRILSGAAAGELRYQSLLTTRGYGCLVQTAECSVMPAITERTIWFDELCDDSVRSDPDAMLRALEAQGWA